MVSNRTALVTGGAGFIGSHLTRGLLADGWSVRILDNFSSGFRRNVDSVRADIDIIEGDICSPEVCRKAFRGVDTVFHLAAMVSVIQSIQEPLQSNDITFRGTLNVLESARRSEVRRLVFSSSAAVYGNADSVPTTEEQPIDPQSPYAADKAAAEAHCRIYRSLYGLETTILRYFNVFGPRQSITSGYAAVIPSFIDAALSGRRPKVFGDGKQTRDFVYVGDVVAANLLAADAPESGSTFNVATGRGTSLLDLLDTITRITGREFDPEFLPAREGEVLHSRADISRISRALEFAPAATLESGLRNILESSALIPA